jgi:hypothetical protein
MGDFQKAVQHCRDRLCQGQEISDACARVIASLYHEGQWSSSYALASSGAITVEPDQLWRELFGDFKLEPDELLMAEMLRAYIDRRWRSGQRDPVPGWSMFWL